MFVAIGDINSSTLQNITDDLTTKPRSRSSPDHRADHQLKADLSVLSTLSKAFVALRNGARTFSKVPATPSTAVDTDAVWHRRHRRRYQVHFAIHLYPCELDIQCGLYCWWISKTFLKVPLVVKIHQNIHDLLISSAHFWWRHSKSSPLPLESPYHLQFPSFFPAQSWVFFRIWQRLEVKYLIPVVAVHTSEAYRSSGFWIKKTCQMRSAPHVNICRITKKINPENQQIPANPPKISSKTPPSWRTIPFLHSLQVFTLARASSLFCRCCTKTSRCLVMRWVKCSTLLPRSANIDGRALRCAKAAWRRSRLGIGGLANPIEVLVNGEHTWWTIAMENWINTGCI